MDGLNCDTNGVRSRLGYRRVSNTLEFHPSVSVANFPRAVAADRYCSKPQSDFVHCKTQVSHNN